MTTTHANEIVECVGLAALSEGQVQREFRKLVDSGAPIRPAGTARKRPRSLLQNGYAPKYKVSLFRTTYYLTHMREDENFRFFVAYVLCHPDSPDPTVGTAAFPRIFYKDLSLVWRSATHYIRSPRENWIGKGDVKWVVKDGKETLYSAEETTNLPLEIQGALDTASRRAKRVRRDLRAVPLILRKAPEHRLEPYRDFSEPRRRALENPCNRIYGGRSIARFTRPGDPTSLRFARGYAPDFDGGIIGVTRLRSRMFGGEVRKLRILSRNQKIQYQFVAGPHQVWIVPPQSLSTEISSYGVRTIDVHADEDVFVPGYEYHFWDECKDPPALHSQIPEGYAGAASTVDPSRADASPWLDNLPVIREFRRKARKHLPR